MSDMNNAVFGLYATRAGVERATEELCAAGFPAANISVLTPRNPDGANDTDAEAGVLGGSLDALVGTGLLVIPGAGPFLAAGPIMAGLARVGLANSVGGIAGALIGMGLPEYEATRYEGHVQNGGTLLAVHCDTPEEIARAKEIMQSTNGDHISSSGESMVDTVAFPLPDTHQMKQQA